MSKKIKLWKHQKKIVKNVTQSFKHGMRKLLVQSPTGSGKTVIFSYMASKVSKRNKKALIITDRIELLSQAGGTIESFKMDPYYIQAGTKFIDKKKNIYIGMSQTLRNRLKTPFWKNFVKNHIDLIIIDEAHKQEFNHLFNDDTLDNKFVLGFTATPKRSGKMTQLSSQYEAIITGPPIGWLIKKGYLVNCDIYDCGAPSMAGVAVNRAKGDYSETSMFKKFDNVKLYKGLVKNYNRIVPGQKMIVFCCSVEHAIKTTKELRKAGIIAKFICSNKNAPKEPRKWTKAAEVAYNEKFKAYKLYQKNFYKYSGEREDVFEWFKSSEKGVLVNVDIATTGFDDPSISVVAIYRATKSLVLYLQMLGRGGRRNDGKTHFTVLDFGDNKARFGGYDVDRDWSLWHEEGNTESDGIPPMKTCGEDAKFNKIDGAGDVKRGCERLIPASLKICPFCGFQYPKHDKSKEADLMLAEIVDKNGVSLKVKPFKKMNYEELYQYRKIKKHHLNWVWRQLWNRDDGVNEIIAYCKQMNYSNAMARRAIEYCEENYD